MSKAPAKRAAAPTPEMALPTIKTAEESVTADMSEPISNMARAQMKVHFAEYRE
jgi:hypothetical protein